jgi:hypothetical protein
MPSVHRYVVRIGSELALTSLQIPWFCGEEWAEYELATQDDDIRTILSTMDDVITVAASEAPKTVGDVSMALLEELRAFRHDVTVCGPKPLRIGTDIGSTLTGICVRVFAGWKLLLEVWLPFLFLQLQQRSVRVRGVFGSHLRPRQRRKRSLGRVRVTL